jgi:hypothetical protein
MFDPRSAAAGVAVMSGVAASLSTAASAAPAPAAPSARYCAVQALPVAAVQRGERSPIACASTPEAAAAALDDRSVSSFAAASAFAAGDLLAIMFDSANGRQAGGPEYWVYGNCAWAGNISADWDNRIGAAELHACSAVKMYKGYNLTDASTLVQGPGEIGLPSGFRDQISSMKFGA